MGGRELVAVLRALCADYAGMHSGLPDLLLWRVREVAVLPQPLPHGAAPKPPPAAAAGEPVAVAEWLAAPDPDDYGASDFTGSGAAGTGAKGGSFLQAGNATAELEFDVMFAEVKGPRDRLSDTQVVWLNLLSEAGVRTAVFHVKERKQQPK